MSSRQILSTLLLAGASAAAGAAQAEPAGEQPSCFVESSRVHTVQPYYEEEKQGDVTLQTLRGAEIQLIPGFGLSADWLERQIQSAIDTSRREAAVACLVDVGRVHIATDELGGAQSVRLIARDPSDGEEVFRRARRLVEK